MGASQNRQASEATEPPPEEQPREPSQRLFFALWPDEAQRSAIARATGEAVSGCGGRPVGTASLHVTLAFLGSVPVRRRPELTVIATQVALALPGPVTLSFDLLEHWAKPQVLCAVSSVPSPAAVSLAQQLQKLTLAAGFSPDIKPFRQHVTLARKVPRSIEPGATGKAGGQAARIFSTGQGLTWTLNGFALVASLTGSAGPLYSVVETYTLYGGGAL